MDGPGLAETRSSKMHLANLLGKEELDRLMKGADAVTGQIMGWGTEKGQPRGRADAVLVNAALKAVSEVYRNGSKVGLTRSDYLDMAANYVWGFREGVLADKSRAPLLLMDGEIVYKADKLDAVLRVVRGTTPTEAREKRGSIVGKQVTSEPFWIEGFLIGALVNNMRPGMIKVGVGAVIGGFSIDSRLRISADRIIETAEKMGKAFGVFSPEVIRHAREFSAGNKDVKSRNLS